MQIFKKLQYTTIILMLLIILFIPFLALAENKAIETLRNIGSNQGPYENVDETGVAQIVGAVISGALTLIGMIFFIMFCLTCSLRPIALSLPVIRNSTSTLLSLTSELRIGTPMSPLPMNTIRIFSIAIG